MKLLLENGSAALDNLGDIAMLKVAAARWRRLMPGVELMVPTEDADALSRLDAKLEAVPWGGKMAWFAPPLRGYRFERVMRLMPEAIREEWVARQWRTRVEQRSQLAEKWEGVMGADQMRELRAMFRALDETDAVVTTGGGYIADEFEGPALRILAGLYAGALAAKPTAFFGLGLGPLRKRGLRRCFQRSARGATVVALREKLQSCEIAREAEIDDATIMITGDDAIELATRIQGGARENSIGLNLRCAEYSEVTADLMERASQTFRKFGRKRRASWTSLPVLMRKDTAACEKLLQGERPERGFGEEVNTPEELARRAGSCRMVVTGSYHAAVFALAQGVPVIAVAQSLYYRAKFAGLADMFGGGCFLVDLRSARFEEDFSDAAERAWNFPEAESRRLVAAAGQQVEWQNAAYERFARVCNQKSKV